MSDGSAKHSTSPVAGARVGCGFAFQGCGIAVKLGVSVRTVEAHRSRIMKTLQVDSTVCVVRTVLVTEGGSG